MDLLAATSVLWPDDIAQSGYLFGWLAPVVCVGGLLDVDTVSRLKYADNDHANDGLIQLDEANSVLERLCRETGSAAVKTTFGSLPVVLGRCSFAQRRPEISFLQPKCTSRSVCSCVVQRLEKAVQVRRIV